MMGLAAAVLACAMGCKSPAAESQGKETMAEAGAKTTEAGGGSPESEGGKEGAQSPEGEIPDGTSEAQAASEGALLRFKNPDAVSPEGIYGCEEYARTAESYMESPALKPVTRGRVEELTELLSGHYEVAGRSDGEGREYYVALRREDAPRYDGFYSLSTGYVDGPEYTVEVCRIGYYEEDGSETILYEIPEYSLKIFGDPETAEALDRFCFIPCDVPDDRYFMNALEEGGRMELDFMRDHPGLTFFDGDVPALTFFYQDEETVTFWSGLYECCMALDQRECEEVRTLLEDREGTERQEFDSEDEAFKWVRGRDSSVRTTGASLHLGEKVYRFLGSRECRGWVMTYESDKVYLEYNEPAFAFAADRIKAVVGQDYGDFTDTWFDVPLTRASLKFPRRTEREDGTWSFETGFQTVTEPEKLEALAGLMGEAVRGREAVSGCPYTGVLDLVREDGETLKMFVAADSCDSVSYEGRIGFEYGDQKELAEIFDEAMK